MSYSEYSEQIIALKQFYPIINSVYSLGLKQDNIIWGGGTALALYYYQHRLSFDIDLFIKDASYLSYFSPKLWIEDYDDFNERYIEQFHHIGVSTNNGIHIDLLVKAPFYKPYLDSSHKFFDFTFYISSIEDIIANKILYRKKDNKSRDIYDIALSIEKDNIVEKLYSDNIITKNDLLEFQSSLENLHYEEYYNNIFFIEPSEEYKEIAIEAPKIIIDNINQIISPSSRFSFF